MEATVAMALVAILMTGLAYSLVSSLKSSRLARHYQQATSLGNRAIESARDAEYHDIAMRTDDLSGDPAVAADLTFDPDGSGPLLSEPLVTTTGGGVIDPHIETEVVDTTTYTVKRYVTWVDESVQGGPGQDVKRIVVHVTWTAGPSQRSYETSAVIARARRGMPVPKLTVTPLAQSLAVDPGNTVVFAHNVRNLGIVDTYDITVTMPGDRTWVATLYRDLDADGVYDAGLDTAMVDTNGDGTVDSGNVVNGETFYFLVVWTLADGDALGIENVLVQVRSGADSSVTVTANDELTVGSGGTRLYLHDNPTPPTAHQNAERGLAMNETVPVPATLYRYSQDLYTNQAGRWVDQRSTSAAENDTRYMANWVWQAPGSTTYSGNATIELWIAAADFACDKHPSITIYLRSKNSAATSAGTTLASGTASSPSSGASPCGYRRLTASIPVTATVAANKWLELKVTVNTSTGSAALFAYDTSTYRSFVNMPSVVS